MKLLLVTAIIMCGCGNASEPTAEDKQPPTCEESINHYYDSACVLYGPIGNAYTLPDAQEICTHNNDTLCPACSDKLDDVLRCLNGVNYKECLSCTSAISQYAECLKPCGVSMYPCTCEQAVTDFYFRKCIFINRDAVPIAFESAFELCDIEDEKACPVCEPLAKQAVECLCSARTAECSECTVELENVNKCLMFNGC